MSNDELAGIPDHVEPDVPTDAPLDTWPGATVRTPEALDPDLDDVLEVDQVEDGGQA